MIMEENNFFWLTRNRIYLGMGSGQSTVLTSALKPAKASTFYINMNIIDQPHHQYSIWTDQPICPQKVSFSLSPRDGAVLFQKVGVANGNLQCLEW